MIVALISFCFGYQAEEIQKRNDALVSVMRKDLEHSRRMVGIVIMDWMEYYICNVFVSVPSN